MPMRSYLRYAAAVKDDQPLYLFDKCAMDTAPELLAEYHVPALFAEERDCFSALGAARPARRWLIVGPHRSGSTFHKDPNATCAWNAVVHGRKRWIMYPPEQQPPGVHASADGAEVAAPMALTEWLLDFYAGAAAQRAKDAKKRRRPAAHDHTVAFPSSSAFPASGSVSAPETGPPSLYPVECTAEPGDVVFVPRGWWHTAINIGTTVAITQNYVPVSGAWATWRFLRDKPEQVSGVPEEQGSRMAAMFEAALREKRPQVWAQVQAQEEAVAAARKARSRISVAGSWLATTALHTDGEVASSSSIGDGADADASQSTASAFTLSATEAGPSESPFG